MMSVVFRQVKDSVFTCLFRQPEYTRELYLALHPEDMGIREDEIEIVTIETIIASGLHNDLGILARKRLMIFAEAQSTFSENVPFRLLLYMAKTYLDYAAEKRLYLYGERGVELPKPELYMIYTGRKKTVPEVMRFSDLYGGGGSIEAEVRVLRQRGTGDIVDQYVRFCEITDGVIREMGRIRRAAEEIIRRCIKEGVLVKFLTSRRKEVSDVMTTLFDQQTVFEMEKYHIYREAEARGIAQGRREEREAQELLNREKNITMVISLLRSMQATREQTENALVTRIGLTPEEAAEQVARQWNTEP